MVVLATKLYVSGQARDQALDALHALVDDDIGALDVSWDIGVRHDEFPTVTVEGSDATAARNVLRETWGVITPSVNDGEERVGTFEAWDGDGIVLDAGTDVSIAASTLELGPGDPQQIRTRFGLVQHLPLRFIAGDNPRLADSTRDQLFDWQRGPDRVNVNSATRGAVRATVNRAGHAQDIITIERLGLLEQSIICKDDTDAPGLLASIGEYLPSELMCVV